MVKRPTPIDGEPKLGNETPTEPGFVASPKPEASRPDEIKPDEIKPDAFKPAGSKLSDSTKDSKPSETMGFESLEDDIADAAADLAGDVPPPHAADHGSKPAGDSRTRIIDATLQLAGERSFDDFGIPDIAERADVSLAEFRDAFPSKGAVLGGFIRKIDRTVLEGTTKESVEDAPKDRLFDVLMRRFDALAPYRHGVEGIRDWARREPLAAAALNREMVNSMRFMLVAAGIDTEGAIGAFKTQGLVVSFGRMLETWLRDDDPGLAQTMAAMDRELNRGEQIVSRAEDLQRFASPLRTLARAVFDTRRVMRDRMRDRFGTRRSSRAEDEYETGRGVRDVY